MPLDYTIRRAVPEVAVELGRIRHEMNKFGYLAKETYQYIQEL